MCAASRYPSGVRNALAHSYRVARRIAVALIGTTVIALGVAMLVLPGPGLVVIPAGLAILALEFAWARRWLRRVKQHGSALLDRVRAKSAGAPAQATGRTPPSRRD